MRLKGAYISVLLLLISTTDKAIMIISAESVKCSGLYRNANITNLLSIKVTLLLQNVY